MHHEHGCWLSRRWKRRPHSSICHARFCSRWRNDGWDRTSQPSGWAIVWQGVGGCPTDAHLCLSQVIENWDCLFFFRSLWQWLWTQSAPLCFPLPFALRHFPEWLASMVKWLPDISPPINSIVNMTASQYHQTLRRLEKKEEEKSVEATHTSNHPWRARIPLHHVVATASGSNQPWPWILNLLCAGLPSCHWTIFPPAGRERYRYYKTNCLQSYDRSSNHSSILLPRCKGRQPTMCTDRWMVKHQQRWDICRFSRWRYCRCLRRYLWCTTAFRGFLDCPTTVNAQQAGAQTRQIGGMGWLARESPGADHAQRTWMLAESAVEAPATFKYLPRAFTFSMMIAWLGSKLGRTGASRMIHCVDPCCGLSYWCTFVPKPSDGFFLIYIFIPRMGCGSVVSLPLGEWRVVGLWLVGCEQRIDHRVSCCRPCSDISRSVFACAYLWPICVCDPLLRLRLQPLVRKKNG